MRLWVLICCVCIGLSWSQEAAADIASLKKQAVRAFKARRYRKAKRLFQRLLTTYAKEQKKQKRGTRFWYIWSLGQGNLHYFLGQIAMRQGAKSRACGHWRKLRDLIKKVPGSWPSWGVASQLQSRVAQSKRNHRERCMALVRTLRLQGQPTHVKAYIRDAGGWQSVPLRKGKEAGTWLLRTKSAKLTLRLQAKGYKARVWEQFSVKDGALISYRLLPEARSVQGPVALHKKWWFWAAAVGGGAVVLGVIIGGAVAANQSTTTGEPMSGANGQGPFVLWKTQ